MVLRGGFVVSGVSVRGGVRCTLVVCWNGCDEFYHLFMNKHICIYICILFFLARKVIQCCIIQFPVEIRIEDGREG